MTRVGVVAGVERIDECASRPWQPAQHVAEFADLPLEPQPASPEATCGPEMQWEVSAPLKARRGLLEMLTAAGSGARNATCAGPRSVLRAQREVLRGL